MRRKGQYIRLGQGGGGGKPGGNGGDAEKPGGNGGDAGRKDGEGNGRNCNNDNGGSNDERSNGNGSGGGGGNNARNRRPSRSSSHHHHAEQCDSGCGFPAQEVVAMSTNVSTQPSSPADFFQQQRRSPDPCGFCRGDHDIDNCKLMWDEKYYPDGLVRGRVFWENRLCFNCGQTGHSTASCPHPRAMCIFCHKPHRSELHVDNFVPRLPNKPVESPNAPTAAATATAPSTPSTAAPLAASARTAPSTDLNICAAALVMPEGVRNVPLMGSSTAAPVAA